ncbi:hypothetical protein SH580_01400 [Coraliomargarita algicola]|uniref:ApeA N-terminal domain-containing protein n=1 Tax=Coraliomargarita algicola TaxID=3092156 RepID=A0ABZ0RJG9_9BACT|nr:HEPN domain-containing protein [Coraliomargarita sp. J2-16]WPJ96356.1 hypothetical protein SH580_01400 [Coraliomargarita sp. J2-16]
MRFEAPEKLSGFFWMIDKPGKRIPGILSISDGGDVELEIIGNFDENVSKAFTSQDFNLPRIHGHVEKRSEVTLDNCFYTNKNFSFGGISKSRIHVNLLISGVWFEKDEEVAFESISFSVDGLDQWVATAGFQVSPNFEDKSVSISYKAPQEENFPINDDMMLSLAFAWSIPGAPLFTEAKVTQSALLKIETKVKQPLRDLISAAYKITNLLSFCIDKTVSISEISAQSKEVVRKYPDGKEIPIAMKVVYRSLPFDEEVPKIESHDMLLRFPQIRKRFSAFICAWFQAYELVEPSINLYFSSRTGAHRFLNGRFLAMAQCLETFHRRLSNETMMDPDKYDSLVETILKSCPETNKDWLSGRLSHGNEVSLRKRLKKIIEPFETEFGGKKAVSRLVDLIVNTRNYFTHFSPDLEVKAADGNELWTLCMKMEAVFQMHLLKQLGLSDDEVSEVLKANRNLQYKIKEA